MINTELQNKYIYLDKMMRICIKKAVNLNKSQTEKLIFSSFEL